MKTSRGCSVLAMAISLSFVGARGGYATEGYFLGGYGATQSALAGAGVANPTDAMSLTLNPAGLVDVGQQFNADVSLFAPDRGYSASGTAFVAPGDHTSSAVFVIPNLAYSQPIDATSAWGVAAYGNGGMNTLYKGVTNSSFSCPGAPGILCAGKAGISLNQGFVELGYAKTFGSLSFGVAPVAAVQFFNAQGLGAFAGLSANPGNMTNNGTDASVGAGLRAGAEWRATQALRFGLAGATPTFMSSFSKYQGLFADQGGFNIPAYVTAGVAWDATANLTLLGDYKHIFYSAVNSVGDSSRLLPAIPFGATGGPGFGWSDVDVVALGAEWRATEKLTLRAGAEFNTNPIKSSQVTLNVLAPGVTTSQFSGGFSYRATSNSSIDVAGYYAPINSVSGPEYTPAGVTPGSNIKLSLGESQLTVGWTYHFDAEAAPVKAKF